jgi:hypothetical protein
MTESESVRHPNALTDDAFRFFVPQRKVCRTVLVCADDGPWFQRNFVIPFR